MNRKMILTIALVSTLLSFNFVSADVIFEDNFDDGVIDSSKWPIAAGNVIVESDGILKALNTVTDKYGVIVSQDIPINTENPIQISRRVKVHYANNYSKPSVRITPIEAPELEFGLIYANYD